MTNELTYAICNLKWALERFIESRNSNDKLELEANYEFAYLALKEYNEVMTRMITPKCASRNDLN